VEEKVGCVVTTIVVPSCEVAGWITVVGFMGQLLDDVVVKMMENAP